MKNQVIRHHFPELDSTNNWCKKEVGSFDPDAITIVTADRQSSGRGQFGKSWVSPLGNIYVSFCFFWEKENVLNIPQLMSLALVDLLKSYGVVTKIKWPNDLLVENKKIAGILCESIFSKGRRAVVLGVGLNISLDNEQLEQIDQPSCSLKSLGINNTSVSAILNELNDIFMPLLLRLESEGDLFFLDRYRKNLIHKKNDPLKNGTFEEIDNEGFMIVKNSQNELIRISSC